jgi:hypothetical protein
VEVRAAEVAAYWADHVGDYQMPSHGCPYCAIIGFGGGDPPPLRRTDEFEARWLAECIAAGDIVIPFLAIRGPGGEQAAEPRALQFFVFEAGTPAHAVEGVIRAYMTNNGWPYADIAAATRFYRMMTAAAP